MGILRDPYRFGNNIMPLYQFKHNETGEIIDKILRISQLDEWKKDNPEYTQYHGGAPALVSGSKSALSMAGSGWKDHLNKIKDNSGRGNTIKT